MGADRHQFEPTILREYDIRGTVGTSITDATARAVGRAFGTMVKAKGGRAVAVGYDGRLSSPGLERAAIDGLTDCGLDVWRIGMGPTPMLYFAAVTLGADGGLMITGSHNPPDQNGFKMVVGRSAFYGAAIQELGAIAAAGSYAKGAKGASRDRAVMDAYVQRLADGLDDGGKEPKRPLAVAWDAGNGAAGDVMARLVQLLPGRHVVLNETVDGRFPSHHPDPTVAENLAQLQAAVARGGCDLGVAFDGDGDRIGAIDGRGRILWADQIMVLLARDVLASNPGGTIIADVKSSRVLFEEIARAGGRPLMWKTGHSLIKAKMAELAAPLAGEMSGHIFFGPPYYGFDDALYAAVRLIAFIGRGTASLAELRDRMPATWSTPEVRFPCDEGRKFAVVEEIKARALKAGARAVAIDGIRVETEDGWWLVRASNTQAVLVARCEARDPAGLARLKQSVAAALDAVGVAAPDW